MKLEIKVNMIVIGKRNNSIFLDVKWDILPNVNILPFEFRKSFNCITTPYGEVVGGLFLGWDNQKDYDKFGLTEVEATLVKRVYAPVKEHNMPVSAALVAFDSWLEIGKGLGLTERQLYKPFVEEYISYYDNLENTRVLFIVENNDWY